MARMITFPNDSYNDDVTGFVPVVDLVDALWQIGLEVVVPEGFDRKKQIEVTVDAEITPPDTELTVDELIDALEDEGYSGVMAQRDLERVAEMVASGDLSGLLDALSPGFARLADRIRIRCSLREKFHV